MTPVDEEIPVARASLRVFVSSWFNAVVLDRKRRYHFPMRVKVNGEEKELADGTTLRQQETFRGLLVPFLARSLDDTEVGFRQMNEALRARTAA